MTDVHVTNRPNLPPDDIAALQSRFGATVKTYRLGLGLSQEELAWQAGMHRTYLADIERGGRNISLSRIVRLVHALGITLPEFFETLAKSSTSTPPAEPRPRPEIPKPVRSQPAVRRPAR